MRLLLFGGDGQLGHEILKRARDLNFEIAAPVMSEVDIVSYEQVSFLANKFKPNIILNAAAYTAVDQAEKEKELAFSVNQEGVANIALVAKSIGARLLHLSTDYVFPGEKRNPYKEYDDTGPLNVYGESKLAGEKSALEIMTDSCLIVRTSSLHGARGHNFVHTMLKFFTEREELEVVSDQFITITWAGWLAEVLLDLSRIECQGIIHAACDGVLSWYDFACAIYKQAKEYNSAIKQKFNIIPVSAKNFSRPAKRPKYSALDCSLLAQVRGLPAINWQEGLEEHLKEIEWGKKVL